MSNVIVPPPPYQSPFVSAQGIITPIWSKWLNQLYLRGGGADAPSNSDFSALTTSFVGANAIVETAFAIVNNQSSPADVTGLLFSGVLVRSAEIDIYIYRNTTGSGATEMCARAKFFAAYNTVAASWTLTPMGVGGDVDSSSGQPGGVTLSITSAGQVQYTSTNITGTAASSKMKFRADTMGV